MRFVGGRRVAGDISLLSLEDGRGNDGKGDAVDVSRYEELLRRYTLPYDAADTELAEGMILRQGLTLIHSSAHPEPFLSQKPPNAPTKSAY